MAIRWGAQPTGPPINPPEPDPRMLVECEGCGAEIHIDYAENIGTEVIPCFVCEGELKCMREVAMYYFMEAITK